MKELTLDAVVVGGGSAGLAAAAEIARRGNSVAVLEREVSLGGILNQCIHNGFGLHYFKEELTGPEYAQRFIEITSELPGIEFHIDTAVLDARVEGDRKVVYAISKRQGVTKFICRAVVLAMGCRERNRGNIGIPGTRPSGIFTAGLAQRLVNIDGYIPGKDVVIVGSGDIGLIMARRMTWVGAKVHAVVEIQPYPSGLTRNIAQCLNDFGIPLYLSHVISEIHGRDRVEGVSVTPIEDHHAEAGKTFRIPCDTLLLSVGLLPDNEVADKLGVKINPETNGAFVDARLMTNRHGVFACGNVLHVHDLVDYVTEESTRCGSFVSDFLTGIGADERNYPVEAGANVKY
ncbi:MAG TPA: FAD-dependent oxidoreductase, partial [Spirochaetia bacterium]|nr:FAD-dependent oxidoreductase [Spirochaetia bacterium]